MTRSMIEEYLFEDKKQQYYVERAYYHPSEHSFDVCLVSWDGHYRRVVRFAFVSDMLEEIYEDYQPDEPLMVIGFREERIARDVWRFALQCLEKGFFFVAAWPYDVVAA